MIQDYYAKNAWDMLQKPDSYLLDVRTDAEWKFVGTPNLGSKQSNYIQASLFHYPHMDINENFLGEFSRQFSGSKDSDIFCLCRSGVRSQKAAEILEREGYANLYNIVDGFEGDIDRALHRSRSSGWKFNELPWIQS